MVKRSITSQLIKRHGIYDECRVCGQEPCLEDDREWVNTKRPTDAIYSWVGHYEVHHPFELDIVRRSRK